MRIHDDLASKTEGLIPFYPEHLEPLLNECLIAMRTEIGQIQTAGDETFGLYWFDQGKENLRKFGDAYILVAKAIRRRIDSLSVIPGS